MNRRHFLGLLSAAALTPLLARAQTSSRPPKILLRSSWNTDNIGDIAHTPGMLALLEKHLPDADVTLAPSDVGHGVEAMLMRRFPRLRITRTKEESRAALEACDFFLHGSGPGLLAGNFAEKARGLGIPYGFGGVSLTDGGLAAQRDILDGARFVYTRDSDSLKALKHAGCTCPEMEFGPDATFALDLRNDQAADKLMQQHRLEPGKFLCAVPRLRWTPTWRDPTEPWAARKISENNEHAEQDHAKVREAIVAWVRETKMRVLLAPEMTYIVPMLRPLLYDGLPDDVKPHVTALDRYWLTDEAASVYAQAAAMVSIEQHSPIIAIACGTPAILLRQPIAGIWRKAQMWNDLGMEKWLFDIDTCTGGQVGQTLLKIARDPTSARSHAAKALDRAQTRMGKMMTAVKAGMH